MPDFTHLHVHTQYSILDGASDIKKLINRVKEMGMSSVAITDHGNMFGVFDFLKAAKGAGIKPIVGCEMYVAEESRFEKKGREDRSGYHLILLAKNHEGYKNLSRLCSLSFKKEAFYYTPRIDKELLRKYSTGLIASSACLGGEIANLIIHNNKDKAEKALLEYIDIFGEDFYLEVMDHGLPEQEDANLEILALSQKHNVKVIATNDAHFINADDAKMHDILVCLNTGKDYDDPNRMKYSGNEFMRSPEQMAEVFSYCPETLQNTQEIVNKVEEYDIVRDVILPVFPLPEGFTNEDDYLKHLTYEGAKHVYPALDEETQQRLEYELKVIKDMGFAGYFLIVSDFINEARKMNVAVGPGRGSAAGSAVAFSVGITSIDPIKYNLLFERFLNPERVSMPDIDVDFDDEGRDRVKEYVVKKYGYEKVAQIVTFGTMAARSSIRDVARVLKLPLQDADRLAKLVPEGPDVSLKKAFAEVPELLEAKNNGSQLVKDTLIYAEKLEGSVRHTGIHACGIIIGPEDLIDHIPLLTTKDTDLMVTQYEGNLVESVGMLKMDFLGLKTLSIIKDAIINIEKRHGVLIDINKIPLDDELTFKLYQKGDTVGTFQFESDGMRQYLKQLMPTHIEDLIAMNALYRPGPMDYIPLFIDRKCGKEKVEYPHPWLEVLLKPTYGIMVYQEQIMQTAQIMAGYSLGAADVLRRAMGKKKKEVMEQQKAIFVDGAVAKGVDKTQAEEVFEVMEKFAMYGFNRSHSAAYSVVAYQTAYLKAHYPAEYMAAVLTQNLSNIKKITFFIEECKRQNIPVLGPDINESESNFFVNSKGEIRFGLGAIKGVGGAAVESVLEEREKNGFYTSIFNFTKRVNLRSCNKRCFEALAMAGAFDTFEGMHRAQFFHKVDNGESTFIDKVIKHSNNVADNLSSSQHSLFGDSDDVSIPDPEIPECEKWSTMEFYNREREVTGIYISGHPLDDYRTELENFCSVKIEELDNLKKYYNRDIRLGGIVTTATHRTSKTGKAFGSIILEDFTGSVQLTLFSEDYLKFKHFMEKDQLLYITARITLRYNTADQFEIRVNNVSLLSEVLRKQVRNITIKIQLPEISDSLIDKIQLALKKSKGTCTLKFNIIDYDERISIELPAKKLRVDPAELLKKLAEIPQLKYEIN
jgi:DNA polymerase III subunit alpha